MIREIGALAQKDLRLLARDRGALFGTFVFPLAYCIFFGFIFSAREKPGRSIEIAIVDEDGSEFSAAFSAQMEEAGDFRCERMDRDRAETDVRAGRKVAFVALPQGFGERATNVLLGGSLPLELGVDPSRRAEAAMISGTLNKYAIEAVSRMLTSSAARKSLLDRARAIVSNEGNPLHAAAMETLLNSIEGLGAVMEEPDTDAASAPAPTTAPEGEDAPPVAERRAWRPIDLTTIEVGRENIVKRSPYEVAFCQGVIWGVLACCATFGISIAAERTTGTLTRLRAAPIGRAHILAGKALACWVSAAGAAALMFTIGGIVFDVSPQSVLLLAGSIAVIAASFVGIMMLLSTLGRTERSVSGISWAVLLVMAMLGGGMVPRFFMPPWMLTLSNASPVKWGILAMEGAVWRGFTLAELLPIWGILAGVGVVCFALGARSLRWSDAN